MTRDWAEGVASNFLGDFGEEWIMAVAAGCGYLQGRPATKDLQRADVQLTLLGELRGITDPTVQLQVKATEQPIAVDHDGLHARFAVDRPTFDALRNQRRTVRRVLAVVWVTPGAGHVELRDEGTLLVGRAAWVSLEEEAPTGNETSVTVRVPLANTIDRTGLQRLLEQCGIPRSTPVPAVEPWTAA